MRIVTVRENKKQYLDLLLLADEQEDMIDRYLQRGELFALYDDDLKSVCVVTREDDGVFEIKNIATYPKDQGKGYGRQLIEYIFKYYGDKCKTMFVGTGDSPLTLPFYEHCGFVISHRVKDFFIDHYRHPIFEGGVQLVDMVYLRKDIQKYDHERHEIHENKGGEE
jgi:GNAT superfamily N-acetyltransferase